MSDFLPLPHPRELFPQGLPPGLVLGLDFDGTLVEIEATPEAVALNPRVKVSLSQIIKRVCPVVICSGRMVTGLESHLGDVEGLSFIGGHGLEWKHQGALADFTPPQWPPFRSRFLPLLQEKLRKEGGWLEDKGSSFTLHYRLSGTGFWQSGEGEKWLAEGVRGEARVMPGKMVWNVLPFGVNKGISLQSFMRKHSLGQVLYFGDEPTDETVFALTELCPWSVLVGQEEKAGSSLAKYRLPDVQAVHAWLDQLSMFERGLM